MKRVIIISILSAFLFSLLLAFSIVWLHSSQWQLELLYSESVQEYGENYIEMVRQSAYNCLRNGLLFLAGNLCTIALYILFAVKEFKVFQPYMDRLNAKYNVRKEARNARKQARNAARAEKAEMEKQKRIEELQAELEQLKKNE